MNSSRFDSSSVGGDERSNVILDVPVDDNLTARSIEPPTSTTYYTASITLREDEDETLSTIEQVSEDLKNAINKVKRRVLTPFSVNTRMMTSRVDPAIEAREQRRQLAKRNRARTREALKGLQFTSNSKGCSSWQQVESNFDQLAPDGYLCRADFPLCIGMKDSREFATALFDALNRSSGFTPEDLYYRNQTPDKIDKGKLYEFWTQITNPSFDSRLKLFFDMVDRDADGKLDKEEIKAIIMSSASACKLSKLTETAEECAALVMEYLDQEGFGYIELWQLESLLLQSGTCDDYSQTLSFRSQPLSRKLPGHQPKTPLRRVKTNMSYFLQENWRRIWVLALWILIMIALFIWKFIQYKHKAAFHVMGYCLPVAKGAAETLKLNMAFILFPVCRNTITWLRSTRLAYAVPLDDNINFHKTIAGAIVLGVFLHAGLHLACDFVRLEQSSQTDFMLYLTDFTVRGQRLTYVDLVHGWEGVTGITMVVLMTIAFTLASHTLRRGHAKLPKLPRPFDRFIGFNAFWYSHHLFIIVYICLLIHGTQLYLVHKWYKKTTWMYVAIPVLLYAWERFTRLFRSSLHKVQTLKASIYPGNVLTLQMSKPRRFRYKSGQYMFVQCSAVSPFEWHPFSITSSPGDNYLGVHIRVQGDWTKKLHEAFGEKVVGENGVLTADETRKRFPKLRIDGPYGAPAQDYRKYDILLLVGLGIGATPFISILKDLINNVIKKDEDRINNVAKNNEEENDYPTPELTVGSSSKGKRPFRTTNAYFYWVTPEHGSFDWFEGVMNEVADLDKKGIIQIHNYLTSVHGEGDARSTLISILRELSHAKNGVDAVSGTKVQAHFGRPKWRKVISRLGSTHPNSTIGVFYCGRPSVAKEVKQVCDEYNQRGGTRFEFHKEHF